MVRHQLPSLLLASLLSPILAYKWDASAPCTRTIVARAGDTCASLSSANSLSVSQFIQLNPSISTCSLVPGTTYCVSTDPNAPAPSTPAPAPPSSSTQAAVPTGSLTPSPDGSEGVCGGTSGWTCLGSVYGDCCSENGYCGNTTEYCSEGCNAGFGRCGGGVPVDPGTGTGSTMTVTVTSLVPGTPVTCPAGPTRTVTATQLVTVATTVTRTQVSTVTASATAKPSPILEGTTGRCKTYYLWKNTDSCTRVARANGVSEDQLYVWNPELDCDDPPRGYYICVGV